MTDTPTDKDWLDIPIDGLSGRFKVNRVGEIASVAGRFGKPGIVRRQSTHKLGYKTINVKGYYPENKKRLKNFLVHRIVAITFIPNPDNLPQVNHISGDKADNRVENLEWCTAQHNSLHSRATGLYVPIRGEQVKASPLTEEDVRDIRMFAAAGIKHVDISRLYPVKRQTINNIVNRYTWRHVA